MYATRFETCVFDITSPQTGMYGCFGFADSPRPWSMICVSCAIVSVCLIDLSAGTAGSTPPCPPIPWQSTHANCTNVCAPAATAAETCGYDVDVPEPAPWTVTVFVCSP